MFIAHSIETCSRLVLPFMASVWFSKASVTLCSVSSSRRIAKAFSAACWRYSLDFLAAEPNCDSVHKASRLQRIACELHIDVFWQLGSWLCFWSVGWMVWFAFLLVLVFFCFCFLSVFCFTFCCCLLAALLLGWIGKWQSAIYLIASSFSRRRDIEWTVRVYVVLLCTSETVISSKIYYVKTICVELCSVNEINK